MEIALSVIADAANRSDTGKLNILGVFSSLYATQMPCHHPTMSLVLSFQASAFERGSSQRVSIRLLDPDGKTILAPPDSTLQVPGDSGDLTPVVNLIANFTNVQFASFGNHRFDILVDGQVKAQIPIFVARVEAASAN